MKSAIGNGTAKRVAAVLFLLILPFGSRADLALNEMEVVLRKGQIVSQKNIGQGITGAKKVIVEKDGIRLEAVFKAVDQRAKTIFLFGTEEEEFFRDSYKHEIAAYKIDRLLGLGLVPPAVERKIGRTKGSIQLWVNRELFRFIHDHAPPDREDADKYVHTVRFLDYLIFNLDRHFRNLFFQFRVAARTDRPLTVLPYHDCPCTPSLPFPQATNRPFTDHRSATA